MSHGEKKRTEDY